MDQLKTTIILSNNINEIEMLKTLSFFNVPSFNVRYMSSLSLAKYLIQLSGISYKQDFIKDEDLAARLYTKIKEIEYFKDSSLNDAINVIKSINDLRHYIINDESLEIHNNLQNKIFKKKNSAVKQVYDLMMLYLKDNDLIDELGIIRFAYENTKVFEDIDFKVYKDSNVTKLYLDMALVNKASNNKVEVIDVSEDNSIKIKSYTKAFGQTNEIENVINYVIDNKIPFDQVLIVTAEGKNYPNIINNYKELLNLPVVISTGISISQTNPGRLYGLIQEWVSSRYHRDYLSNIINDVAFNKDKFLLDINVPESFNELNKDLEYPETISIESIITTVGNLRISFDCERNNKVLNDYVNLLNHYQDINFNIENTDRRVKELPFVKAIFNVFNKGISNFMSEYSSIIDEVVDSNALNKILKTLSYEEYGVSKQDIDKRINSLNISRRTSKEGNIYFTTIDNAFMSLRPYVFIVGLSSNNFPGSSREDPILLDKDYEGFNVENASSRGVKNNRDTYLSFIRFASKYNVEIHLSYSYYNSETLKTQNASSVLFETYKKESNQDNKTVKDFEDEFENNKDKFKTIEFFDNDLLAVNSIGKAIKENKHIQYESEIVEDSTKEVSIPVPWGKKGLSASAINLFVDCPYQFYLAKVLKVEQPEETDLYEIIAPNEKGTLAHYLLETLDKSKTSLEEFKNRSSKAFDEFLIMHQTDNPSLADKEKEEFVEMMANGYEMEKDEITELKEQDIMCFHSSGVGIHGLPDKVVSEKDGTLRIIDYKTGRRIKHDSGNAKTMLQCVVYAYVLENNSSKQYKVSGFEYRYLLLNRTIRSDSSGLTMKDYYKELETQLDELKKCVDTGIFPINSDHCEKCYYKDVCPRKVTKKNERR